jgi:hypothetical protein
MRSASWSASSRYCVVSRTVVPPPTRERVEAGRGFVQEQHLRVADQGSGQVQAAPHAAAVGADRFAAGVGEAEALQELGCAHARVAGAQVVQAAEHLQVLAAAELLVEGRVLAEQTDAQPYVVGRALHVVARHLGAALVRAQQGGLARAVGAEHAVDAAGRDPQVEPIQGGLVAVPLPQAFRDDHVGHRAPSPGLRM